MARHGPGQGPGAAAGSTADLLVVGLWLLTRAVLLVVSLNPRLYSAALFGDIRFYGAKVERMFQGELPYRDVATEYPPGSVPFTILPALVVGTGGGYRLAFACEMLLVDAVGLWAATRLGRVVDAGRRRIPLAYVLAMVAVGPLLVLRFDLVPAVCVLVAVAMAAEGRFGWAAAALGYGTAAKIFPGVLAPLLVLGMVPALGWRRSLLRTVPPFLAGFGLTVVPALALSVRGTADSVLYHVQRGVQVESLWANLIGIAHLFGLPARTVYGFGAYDLSSSLSGPFKALSGVATLAALAARGLAGLAPGQGQRRARPGRLGRRLHPRDLRLRPAHQGAVAPVPGLAVRPHGRAGRVPRRPAGALDAGRGRRGQPGRVPVPLHPAAPALPVRHRPADPAQPAPAGRLRAGRPGLQPQASGPRGGCGNPRVTVGG